MALPGATSMNSCDMPATGTSPGDVAATWAAACGCMLSMKA
jgi:hypothetical protein